MYEHVSTYDEGLEAWQGGGGGDIYRGIPERSPDILHSSFKASS